MPDFGFVYSAPFLWTAGILTGTISLITIALHKPAKRMANEAPDLNRFVKAMTPVATMPDASVSTSFATEDSTSPRILFDPSLKELKKYVEKREGLTRVRTVLFLSKENLAFLCTTILREGYDPKVLFGGQKEEEAVTWDNRRSVAKALFKDKKLVPAFQQH